ncbi:MAG: general secretion pathway protein GspB [Ramlibacter sp.]|nr:general secretion pathway protein GspB [Ramlibacter sp.]
MSYILDALKRAEAQRARGSVPGLNALPTMAVPQDTQRSARTVWWVSATAVVVVAGAAWWWLASPVAPAAKAPAAATGAAPGMDPPPAAAVQTPSAEPVVPPVAAARPAPAKARAAAPAASSAKAVARAGKASGPTTAAAAASAPPPRIPTLAELPDDLRRQVPAMAISGAAWSENAAMRMVIINGQVFTEGTSPAPDVVLEQIRQRSAVLRFRGQQFQLPH